MNVPAGPRSSPAWADFPAAEYSRRIAAAQAGMLEAGIDLLLLTQRQNIVYFTGLQSGHWVVQKLPTALLLVSCRQDPVLIIPAHFASTVRGTTWVEHLEFFADPRDPSRSVSTVVSQAILQLAGPAAVIGLELGDSLVPRWDLADYQAIRDAIPEATFTAGADVIWSCRMVKSRLEIDRLRAVARLTERAMLAVRDELREGMTEREIATRLAVNAFDLGADDVVLSAIRCGRDRYSMADSLPTDRPIGPNEMLILHPGFAMRSYVSALSHHTYVGRPTRQHREAWATIVRVQEAVLEALHPGATARDAFDASHRIMVECGWGAVAGPAGHGIGLDLVEPPYLVATDDRPLQPGMVLALESWIFDAQGLGVLGLGEMAVVTDDGAELLTGLSRDELWSTA